MLPVDDATPTFTLVGRYFYDYASLMIDFHNTMLDLADAEDAVRYAAVLKFDGEMRALCAEKIPGCFKPGMPIQSNWPKWSPWARKSTLPQYQLLQLIQEGIKADYTKPQQPTN